MKYKLAWTDSTIVNAEYELVDEKNPEPTAEALNELLKSRFMIPVEINVTGEMGDVVDFEVFYSFDASDINEAKNHVKSVMHICGREIEVWSLMDDRGNVVCTEEEEEITAAVSRWNDRS